MTAHVLSLEWARRGIKLAICFYGSTSYAFYSLWVQHFLLSEKDAIMPVFCHTSKVSTLTYNLVSSDVIQNSRILNFRESIFNRRDTKVARHACLI